MAKKDALIDLQNRLADRLVAARTAPASMAWLAVLVGTTPCLLPLVQSGEIFPVTAVARVPYAKNWFVGVVNLRGGLYGVVDLASFMGGTAPFARSELAWTQAQLVTFNVALDINCALVVDGLMGLRRQEAFTSAEPAPAGAPAYLGQRLCDAQGKFWQELDLLALSQAPAFLNIGS